MPHTIPSSCTLVVDRRFLPGDSPEAIVAEIAQAMSDLPCGGHSGQHDASGTRRGDGRNRRRAPRLRPRGARPATRDLHPRYTFDAGYGCARGVPTVMCGPSSADMAGPGLLGEDFVAARRVREAAALYAAAVTRPRPGERDTA